MILLKFKTEIKGNSKVKEHDGWITLDAVDFSCGREISVSSGGTDRETSTPNFSNIRCTKDLDVSSVELFHQSICGKSLGEATINFLQTGGKDADQVFMTITLHDPIVTSYSTGCRSGDRPSERFDLNFTKIKIGYTQFNGEDKKPVTPKGWDLMSKVSL